MMCFSSLATVKLLYFVWFGASSCVLPYLSLHMRELGVPAWESSIISGILPLFQLLTCPIACIISRTSPSYKKSLMWSLLFTTIASILLLQAPSIPAPTEKKISMHFQCGPDIEPGIIVDKCNYQCDEDKDKLIGNTLDAFFTECHVDCPNRNGVFKNTADLCFDNQHRRVCHIVEVNNTLSENFTFGISLGKVEEKRKDECLYQMEGVTWHQAYYHHISCPIILKETNTHTKCTLKCDLQEVPDDQSRYFVTGTKRCLKEGQKAVSLAIWVYFGLRAIFHFSHGISSMMIDNGLSSILRTERKSHRKYSIWSYLSSSIITPFAGLSVDYRNSTDFHPNYAWLFLAFSGFVVLTIVLVGSLEFGTSKSPPLKDLAIHMLQVIREPEISVLFLIVFLLGVISGFFDTFLFWYLQDLSCPYYIMGFTISTGLLIGFPLMIKKCSSCIESLGRGNLLTLCIVFQCLRCMGYYFADNFLWSFLFELWGAIVFHILWKTVSVNSKVLVPVENLTAFRAFAGALHYGLGKGCGSFAGGALMTVYGFPFVFLTFGSSCGILAVFYFILYHSILKRLPKNLIRLKKRPADVVAGLDDTNAAFLLKPSTALALQSPAGDMTEAETENIEEGEELNA